MKKKRFIFALLCVFMIVALCACKKNNAAEDSADLSAFKPPLDFVWEGSYIDESSVTTLTIEKDGRKNYKCTISTSDADFTHLDVYEFTAEKDDVGLKYENGIHTVYDIPDFDADPDASVNTSEAYSDGTGNIYYLKDHLYWIDNKNAAGSSFAFRRVEETE